MEKPTKEKVTAICKEFDHANKVIESALEQLFKGFPKNKETAHILLKVIAVNSLYSTQIPMQSERIPTVWEVADHIKALNIDSELDAGSLAPVFNIAKIESPTKKVHYNYSFATKYCNWHRPEVYPIYDSRVDEYLWHFMKSGHISHFDRQDLKIYKTLKEKVSEFRNCCGLDELNFKELDKFLYSEGGKLLDI